MFLLFNVMEPYLMILSHNVFIRSRVTKRETRSDEISGTKSFKWVVIAIIF